MRAIRSRIRANGGYGHRHAHCGNQVPGVSLDDRMKGYFIAPAWLFHLLLTPPKVGRRRQDAPPDEWLPGWRGKCKMPGPPP
jgi:hypothetical protein